MNFKTHQAAGLVAAEATLLHFQQPLLSWVTPVALVGGCLISLLSDIDKPSSKIGRKLWLISQTSSLFQIRHRTLTHSILFTAILWLVLTALPISDVLVWALVAAFCSHWFIDLFNEAGVELLWPVPFKFRLLPPFLSISSEDLIGQPLFRLGLNVIQAFMVVSLCQEYIVKIPILGPLINSYWAMAVSVLPNTVQEFLF